MKKDIYLIFQWFLKVLFPLAMNSRLISLLLKTYLFKNRNALTLQFNKNITEYPRNQQKYFFHYVITYVCGSHKIQTFCQLKFQITLKLLIRLRFSNALKDPMDNLMSTKFISWFQHKDFHYLLIKIIVELTSQYP